MQTTSSPTNFGSPRHLLAVDAAVFGDPDAPDRNRLRDRIDQIRPATVLVYIGADKIVGLPDPDYSIDVSGTSITRLPAGDTVEEWPGADDPTGIDEALAHLADALLVPWSDVYCVAAQDREDLDKIDSTVVVRGGPDTYMDEIIAGLDGFPLFGGAAGTLADVCDTAFDAALDTLNRNVTPLGFTAASLADNPLSSYDANYAAVWARDGVMTGLWTMCLDDPVLTDTFRETIRVLARHQAPTGQIPSNVRLADEVPDYSGIGGIGSVDSVMWFVIGAIRLAFQTGDRSFAEEIVDNVIMAMSWLAAHDANNDALLEIPESSDWMDIFPRSYNVLYDEVLWWQACLDTAALFDALGRDGAPWRNHATAIRSAILDQFWPTGEQLMEIAGTKPGRFSPGEAYYLLSQITPFDYGWRCDVYANLLAALAGLLDDRKLERLFTFLWGVGVNQPFPVTCLYPPITSGAEDWKDYFLVNFLNIPDHYHNGGIWPFIGGLWVRYLAEVGRIELAHRELAGLAESCRQGINGEWEFNEWLHGTTGRPMGKTHQAWSAASYVHAYASLRRGVDPKVFPTLDPEALSG